MTFKLFRRHKIDCPHKDKGRDYRKCDCPIHCDGIVNGSRVIRSLHTVNWDRARRRLRELEEDYDVGRIHKTVTEAVKAFLSSKTVKSTTMARYVRQMDPFMEYFRTKEITSITVEDLDNYKLSRSHLAPLTWSKELQTIRDMFTFSIERGWRTDNPAKARGLMPKDPRPKDREPYTEEEIARIVRACDTFGKSEYERRRARAMILLMKYFALRVSDVATLRRDRIKDGALWVRALKNGKPLWMPIDELPDLIFALEAVPMPMNQAGECVDGPYYFWTGEGEEEGHIKTVVRTLQAVFRESGVENAHTHKFRHTLATKILAEGGTFEDAAIILGDSPSVIERHYAKFSLERQRRTNSLLKRIHVTPLQHENFVEINPLYSTDRVVLEVGVEPT